MRECTVDAVDRVGVAGRSGNGEASGSARRRNCSGVRPGEPFPRLEPGEDLSDRGLWASGETMAKEGSSPGSGVCGERRGRSVISAASSSVAELIHFSSACPGRGGEVSNTRKLSAKCSEMNLGERPRQPHWIPQHHIESFTHFDNSDHPPPTRTITVCDRRIRQKHNFGSWSPIQYFPLWSLYVSVKPSTLIPTGSLFTTSPTATSSLLFGSAT